MPKPLNKLVINNKQMIFLDGKPLKGVQAMQFTMDVKSGGLGLLQLVMLVKPDEIAHDKVETIIHQKNLDDVLPPTDEKPEPTK